MLPVLTELTTMPQPINANLVPQPQQSQLVHPIMFGMKLKKNVSAQKHSPLTLVVNVLPVWSHLFGINLKEHANWDVKKLTFGIKPVNLANVQSKPHMKSMVNVSLAVDLLNGKMIHKLVNLRSIHVQLHLLQLHQLQSLHQHQLQSHQHQLLHQLFKLAIQTLFGTTTSNNVCAQLTSHSMMEQNVFNATYLNTGITIWNNVYTAKETLISTQSKEIASLVQLTSRCLETTIVKPAHKIPFTIQDQTHANKLQLIQLPHKLPQLPPQQQAQVTSSQQPPQKRSDKWRFILWLLNQIN